ncbi:MAG: hypothetical protein MO846_05275 [Candidatus Devosia symbiotica]|nr:hypothetical protein [Candidatus Devosia symbiotica]
MQLWHGFLDRSLTAVFSSWYALIKVSRMAGTEPGALQEAVEVAFEKGLIDDAVFAEALADRTRMWVFREQMSEVQSKEGASIKHDVSVPIAAVSALIARGIAAAERISLGIRQVPFGHMGDGNIHFNFSQPLGVDAKTFIASNDEKSTRQSIRSCWIWWGLGVCRAWHWPAQAQIAQRGQGPGSARHDAGDQDHA